MGEGFNKNASAQEIHVPKYINVAVYPCLRLRQIYFDQAVQMPTKQSVLFFTNSELGQASVILAVAYEVAILSEYDVNIASFAPLQGQVNALNENFNTKINWHTISGKSMKECLAANGFDFLPKHAPRVQGAVKAYKECLPHVIAPWTPEEYGSVLRSCKELIKKLDPALVVIGKFIDQCTYASTI